MELNGDARKYIYENILSKKMRNYISEDMLYFNYYGKFNTSSLYFDIGQYSFRINFTYRGLGAKINSTTPLKIMYNGDGRPRHTINSGQWDKTFTSTVYDIIKEHKLTLLINKL